MSLRVGLGASQADLDVQGEIDFDFFEESDVTHSSKVIDDKEGKENTSASATVDDNAVLTSNNDTSCDINSNKPVITVSCEKGAVQKTTIQAVIPTPYDYKENKCGRSSPGVSKRDRKYSPRMRNKIFANEKDISDDSSISSMSASESEFSSLSDESLDKYEEEEDSMTDVSPLESPHCQSPMNDQNGDPNKILPKTIARDLKLLRKEGVKFMDQKHKELYDSLDLQELLKAVKRLENEQKSVESKSKSSTPSLPRFTQNGRYRKNMSFSNEEVQRIDNDNRNLLKKIIAQQKRPKPRQFLTVPVAPSSAINRQRQQRQIEIENMALLRRLESTKPSRDVCRDLLLHDYERRCNSVSSRTSSRSSRSRSTPSNVTNGTPAHSSGRSSKSSINSSSSVKTRSTVSSLSNRSKKSSILTDIEN